MGGGFELPRGTDTPGVEELPQEGETSRVTLEGDGVPGADGQGQERDINSPSTRYTEGSSNTSRRENMSSRQEPAALLSTQRRTAEG